ncbi:MAG TPA: hypothetical protein VMF08_23055 [Candidatus Sulfotelmatobacter sp.]|nr:hypothetical protein [Candidatus Sulfotelmatobacter sp.]
MTKKQAKPNYLTLLQQAIEERHKCSAVHRESVHVHETMDDKTIWAGEVEVFELDGHAEAATCYAWSHRERGANGSVLNSETMRLITVLGKRPVDSPQMAVRAAIFYDVQPPHTGPSLGNAGA